MLVTSPFSEIRRHRPVCVLVGLAAISGCGSSDPVNSEPEEPDPIPIEVSFNDSNLEGGIREEIGRASGPIYASDMVRLKILDLHWTEFSGRGRIADLSGLEYATSLDSLWLGYNSVTDLSPISGLTSLRALSVRDNQISDISPLAPLTGLKSLGVGGNPVQDYSVLASFGNLTFLHVIGSEGLASMPWLPALTKLEWLVLAYSPVTDIKGVAGLTGLTHLLIPGTSISDLSTVTNLVNLEEVDFDDNAITDLGPLVANTGIGAGDMVWIRRNPLTSPDVCSQIDALQTRGVTVHSDLDCG